VIFLNKGNEDFHRKCGEILRMAIDVESNLDAMISHYFCYPHHDKEILLYESIITKIGFDRKIEILKDICKKEGIKLKSGLIQSINFVKDIRNQVAHREAWTSKRGEGIELRPLTVTRPDQILVLTNDLMKEVEEKRLSAIKGLAEIVLELSPLYSR